jgi:hypothetical protein
MLGQFSGKHQSDSSLDFSGRKCGLLVVGSEFASFGGDTFKDIINEGVHDRHTLLGDTGIRMDLFQYLEDVRRVRFDTLLGLLRSTSSLIVHYGGVGECRQGDWTNDTTKRRYHD